MNRLLVSVIIAAGILIPVSGMSEEKKPSTQNEMEDYVVRGINLIKEGKSDLAIKYYLNNANHWCENTYAKPGVKLYAARDNAESLAYLMMTASESGKKNGKESGAVIIPYYCALALYSKGYALIELHDMDSAEVYIKRAIEMAPKNAQFLSELGHIYQQKKLWQQAFDLYNKAETAASEFSPKDSRSYDLARAKRGVGFVLIEMGQMDKAKEKFMECLKINPNDRIAQQELRYIEQLKARSAQ